MTCRPTDRPDSAKRMQKTAFRNEAKKRLGLLSKEACEGASLVITQKVLALPAFAEAGSVFSYVSVGKEPDTRAILREALKLGKKVFVPRCGPAPFMEAVRIRDLSELTRGRFGIPEPSGSEICTPDEPDLILVPCLSASGDGRRIGHGSGYYDAFLQAAEKEGYCLCYSAMLSDDIPIDEHDVRVKVITEDPDTSWKKNQ